MAHRGVIHVGELFEGSLAVETKSVVSLFKIVAAIAVSVELAHLFVTRLRAVPIEESPRAPARKELQTGVDDAKPTPVFEAGVEVTHFAQFGNDPTFVDTLFVTL